MAGTLTGGLRDRMLLQSFFDAIQAELTTRGWFDAGRQHGPIVMIDEYPGDNEPPQINTIAISMGDGVTRRAELGSLADTRLTFMYADFYAESDALCRHVVGDIATFLSKFPVVPVKDFAAIGDPIDFHAYVDDDTVDITRPSTATNAWQKHWGIVSWQVEDDR
jgi:hypothetical protein